MATESFGKVMEVKTLEGVKNIVKAIEAGSFTERMTPDQHAMVREMSNPVFTEEAVAQLRKKYGVTG